MSRFDTPIGRADTLPAGNTQLIQSTAQWQERTEVDHYLLHRYLKNAVRDVATTLDLPLVMSDPKQMQQLEQIRRSRGVRDSVLELLQRIDSLNAGHRSRGNKAIAIAININQWKKEMLRESRGH